MHAIVNHFFFLPLFRVQAAPSQFLSIRPNGESRGISGNLSLGPFPMGSEGLLFFCPIFWSAFFHTHTRTPRSWLTPSRAMRTALLESPALPHGRVHTRFTSSPRRGRLVQAHSRKPTPTERNRFLYLPSLGSSSGSSCTKFYGAQFFCLIT